MDDRLNMRRRNTFSWTLTAALAAIIWQSFPVQSSARSERIEHIPSSAYFERQALQERAANIVIMTVLLTPAKAEAQPRYPAPAHAIATLGDHS